MTLSGRSSAKSFAHKVGSYRMGKFRRKMTKAAIKAAFLISLGSEKTKAAI
ncbi:MAG: hypothetical protein KGJ97_09150 [Xanthomonadaceae bacterium]|jgi:hypothetical protein|nr:hypothetical protein [Xanthomonadaceae bacterium]